MTGPTLRKGHTYRVYDWGRFTFAFDPEWNFGVFGPRIAIIYRQPAPEPGRPLVIRYRRLNIPLPVISFRTAFKLRKFGALWLYKVESRLIYRMFRMRYEQ